MAEPILHLSLPVDDLAAARSFYEEALGCRLGRARDRWFDVWFFGLQLTLALRPDEVRDVEEQGARRFGVVLGDAQSFWALVERLDAHGVAWLARPARHDEAELSGKVLGRTLRDPAGNVIEIKHYADPDDYLARGGEPGAVGSGGCGAVQAQLLVEAADLPVDIDEVDLEDPVRRAARTGRGRERERGCRAIRTRATAPPWSRAGTRRPGGRVHVPRSHPASSATGGPRRTTRFPVMSGRLEVGLARREDRREVVPELLLHRVVADDARTSEVRLPPAKIGPKSANTMSSSVITRSGGSRL